VIAMVCCPGGMFATGGPSLEHVVVNNTADSADNQDDLECFLNEGGEIRLVSDFRSGKLAGIAFRGPQDWDWREIRLEGEVSRVFREAATGLITDQLTQHALGVTLPSGFDGALDRAAAVLSPQVVLGKLANAAAQVAACHAGFPHIAKAAGKVAEQAVASLPVPDGMPGRALDAARDCVVTCDLAGGHLTGTVRDFIADKEAGRINDLARGVTPGQTPEILVGIIRSAKTETYLPLPRPDAPSRPPAGLPSSPSPSPALPRPDAIPSGVPAPCGQDAACAPGSATLLRRRL
jgi:hypothetical protein